MLVTDLIVNTVNGVAGTNWATTRQVVDQAMDALGVEDGDTAAEQLIGLATEAASGARGYAEIAQKWMQRNVNPLVQNIGTKMLEMFAARPGQQAVEEVGGVALGAAGRGIAENREMGPVGTALMEAGGGILGGAIGSGVGEVGNVITYPATRQAAQTVRRPGEGFTDYSQSELRNRPRSQGGQRPTQEDVANTGFFETLRGGTGEFHFRRNNENIQELERLMGSYGVEIDEFGNAPNFSRQMMDDFIQERSSRLSQNVEAKNDVIQYMSREGDSVPVTKTDEYLDEQFASAMELDTAESRRLAQTIEEWRGAIAEKDMDQLERTRKSLLRELQNPNNADIKTEGTRILNEAYTRLTEDMGEYIKDSGFGPELYDQWRTANTNLSSMARDFSDRAFVEVLDEWDKGAENIRPEVITSLLESRELSDAQKLYRSLSPEGQELARQSLISRFATTTNTDEMSPTLFARNVKRYGDSIGVYFDEDEVQYLQGLKQHFDITKRSEQYVNAFRNFQGPPTSSMPGAGTAISMGVRSNPLVGLLASVGTMGTLGRVARILEQRPQIKRMLGELATLDPDGVPAQNLSRIITQATAEAFSEIGPQEEAPPDRNTSRSLVEPQLRME
jgi:hypothetical protein